MFEFDIFEIMYPIVEERDAEMERLAKCHLELIKDYEKLFKEYDKSKELRKDYDILEQKYWDAQRLISEYALENEELKRRFCDTSNSMNLYKYKKDVFEKDNEKLLKELNAVKTELAETKKYLEGYQRLYIEEALKNTDPNYMDISEKYLRVIEKYKKACED